MKTEKGIKCKSETLSCWFFMLDTNDWIQGVFGWKEDVKRSMASST
jgi:hypothetical protein